MLEFVGFMVGIMKLAPATTDRRVAVASSYFDYMRGLSNGRFKNPLRVRRFRRPRRRSQRPQPVDEGTIERLLEGINNSRDDALVDLLIKSGLRISELQQLNRNSIRVQRGVCQVPPGWQMRESTASFSKTSWGIVPHLLRWATSISARRG